MKSYCECGQFIGKEGNRNVQSFQPLTIVTKSSILDVAAVLDQPLNVMLDRDLKTFYEISVFWTTQKMTKVIKITKSDSLSTILTRVSVIVFQMMILKALTSIW